MESTRVDLISLKVTSIPDLTLPPGATLVSCKQAAEARSNEGVLMLALKIVSIKSRIKEAPVLVERTKLVVEDLVSKETVDMLVLGLYSANVERMRVVEGDVAFVSGAAVARTRIQPGQLRVPRWTVYVGHKLFSKEEPRCRVTFVRQRHSGQNINNSGYDRQNETLYTEDMSITNDTPSEPIEEVNADESIGDVEYLRGEAVMCSTRIEEHIVEKFSKECEKRDLNELLETQVTVCDQNNILHGEECDETMNDERYNKREVASETERQGPACEDLEIESHGRSAEQYFETGNQGPGGEKSFETDSHGPTSEQAFETETQRTESQGPGGEQNSETESKGLGSEPELETGCQGLRGEKVLETESHGLGGEQDLETESQGFGGEQELETESLAPGSEHELETGSQGPGEIQGPGEEQGFETEIQGPGEEQGFETESQGQGGEQDLEIESQGPRGEQNIETESHGSGSEQALETESQVPASDENVETECQEPESPGNLKTGIKGPSIEEDLGTSSKEPPAKVDFETENPAPSSKEDVETESKEDLETERQGSRPRIPFALWMNILDLLDLGDVLNLAHVDDSTRKLVQLWAHWKYDSKGNT